LAGTEKEILVREVKGEVIFRVPSNGLMGRKNLKWELFSLKRGDQ
jgi:hypothetical protein